MRMDKQEKKNITIPLFIVFMILVLGLAIPILVNLLKIQVFNGEEWRERADEKTMAWRDVKAQRGTIFSSDGKILATTVPVYDIYIDWGKEEVVKKVNGKEKKTKVSIIDEQLYKRFLPALCDSLARLFPERTFEEYYTYISKNHNKGNRYCLLRKHVSHKQMKRMQAFPILMADTTGKKIKGDFEPKFCRGVIPEQRDDRIYPYNGMARHTIGFITKDTAGRDTYNGLDGFYDVQLRGQQGKRLERKILHENGKTIWQAVESSDQKRTVDGHDIVSTIDARLQELAQSSLKKCLEENDADDGCVVLMEVNTGYVRAISNLTRIDTLGNYREIKNIACTDLYDPGSTFKTVTAMVLLENGKVDTADVVPTGIKVYSEEPTTSNPRPQRDTIKDSHNDGTTGTMSMKHSFEVSSNVGTSYPVWMNYRRNPKDFRKKVSQVLPFQKLGLDLATHEPNPQVVEDMSVKDLLRFSFGYSASFTALQILTFYNAIANDGKMVKPLFCSEIRDGSKTVKTFEPLVIKEKICSEKTLGLLHDLLVGVVENGSAQRRLSKTPYGIAGKTGTSQINYTRRNRESMKYRASFAGYFPADNPQYSCIVVITNPKKNRVYGGELAAPVFKDLADRVCGTILNMDIKIPENGNTSVPFVKKGNARDIRKGMQYLGINSIRFDTSYVWVDAEQDSNGTPIYSNYVMPKDVVPNCKGMTIKDALFMLEKMGFQVSFEGRGKVASQSLQQNTPYRRGARMHLVLSPTQQALPEYQYPQPVKNETDKKTGNR